MTSPADRSSPPIDHDRACRFATRIVGNCTTAEDMVQEASLRVMDRAIRLPGANGFQRYFYRALTNLCLNELDRHRRERKLLERSAEPQEHQRSAHHSTVQGEESERVREALRKLPDRQCAALVLKEWEGLSYQQIADSMEISETNAATLVYRGLKRLRDDLSLEVDR